MRAFALGLAFVLAVAPTTTLLAQQGSDPSPSGSNGAGSNGSPSSESGSTGGGESQALDVDDLGISVGRIKRRLQQNPSVVEAFDGQRLRSYIQVYGMAPKIDLFRDGELSTAPAPYGGMTHSEFMNLVTPQEFRSPAANLSNVGTGIIDWFRKRSKEKKEREERERRVRQY